MGLGATTTTTTTPTPKAKISGAITDLKSIQSKLNELLASESLVAEEIDPTTTEAPLTIKPVLAVTTTKPPILDEIKTSPVVTTDAKQISVESARADSVIQPVPCSEVKLQSEVNAAVQNIGLMTDKKPSVESTTELPQTTVSASDIPTTSPPIPVNTANVPPVVIADDYAKQISVESPQADSVIQPVPSIEVELKPLLNVAVQTLGLLKDEKQSVESTTQSPHTTESVLDIITTSPPISDNAAKISPAVITDDYAKENLLEPQADNDIHPAPYTLKPELNAESTVELPHTIISVLDIATPSPHISENTPTISPEISNDVYAKQISLESSRADSVVQPVPSTELDLEPELNNSLQSTGLINDEEQSVESTIEIPPTTVSVSDLTITSPPTSDDADNILPPVETTDDYEKQASQSDNDIQLAPCNEVDAGPSELKVSLQNLGLQKDEKENVEVEQPTDPSALKPKDAEESDQIHLGDNSQDELSIPVLTTFDQTEVGVPLKDDPQPPSTSEDSTLMYESTDPVIYSTKIQVAEHPDPNEEDTHLISKELPLPAFPKVGDVELPEQIITEGSTDSLLPEVQSEIPNSILSESPDNESTISSQATEENADVNPSSIPLQESMIPELNILPSQEDPSTNQPEADVPISDSSNTIQLGTEDEQTLLSTTAPLTPTEADTQSAILNDVHSPIPAADGMNILPTITCATLRVNSMPEATPPIPSPESTVVNYSELSEKYSPYLTYGNAALQYQTYRLPITASIDNSVMGFNNWFNYRNKPLIDIHDNEINLMEIVIA